MAGFRRGIGTRAKTKLDVGTLQRARLKCSWALFLNACYKYSCFQMMEQAKCYKSESLDARPAGNLRLT